MHDASYLQNLVVVIGAALVVVVTLNQLRLPAIAGFLVAGALMGPSGLALFRDSAEIERFAEVGVILLLFTIGLEFSLSELRRLGRLALLGGTLQVGMTVGAVALVSALAGQPAGKSVFIGFLVALSSTAIVLKGLAERGETDAPHGRLIVGVLLFQDLSVIPMVLLLPTLAGRVPSLDQTGQALGTAVVVIGIVGVLARWVIPWAMKLVAATRRRDLFVLAVLVVCAGITWLTSVANLSVALGAFLAGLVLADSEYGHQALGDILPLRDVFTSIFFISIGLLLDVRVLAEYPLAALVLTLSLLAGKGILGMLAAFALRLPLRVAVLAGLSLSQIGEFSFVLAREGRALDILGPGEGQLFFAASVITMAVTPFLLRFGPHLAAGASRWGALDRLLGPVPAIDDEQRAATLEDHIVVLGHGVGGEMLTEALWAAGQPLAVVDINANNVRVARQRGLTAVFGDAASPDILSIVGVQRARFVAVMLNDPDATVRAVRTARSLSRDVRIVVRARYAADVTPLMAAGASEVVAQELEVSFEIISRLMRHLEEEQPAAVEAASAASARLASRLPAGVDVMSVAVLPDAWIAGRSVAQAQLRARTGATLLAVSRGDETSVHPAPDDTLESGDVLCLVGDAQQLAAAERFIVKGPRSSES